MVSRARMQRIFRFLVIVVLALAPVAPAQAGQAELDLLTSFVGNWKGSGELIGGDEPETFTCRMTIAKGTQTKINFAGRCAVAGLNLSVQGTIAYNDAEARYEGIMTSNTAYSGLAIGRQRGGNIAFDFTRRETDEKGQDLTVGSKILLAQTSITVDFEVTFNESGDTMRASVPFDRVGG